MAKHSIEDRGIATSVIERAFVAAIYSRSIGSWATTYGGVRVERIGSPFPVYSVAEAGVVIALKTPHATSHAAAE